MTGTVIDFAQLLKEAKAGSAWPEGDYDLEVVESNSVKAESGSLMIKAKMRVIVGAYANKHLTNNFVMKIDSPGSLNMFFRHMAAFGLDESWIAQLGQINADDPNALSHIANALLGRRARFTIGHREWPKGSGALQNDVKAIKPITDGIGAGGPTGSPTPPSAGLAGPSIPQAPAAVPPPPAAAAPPAPPVAPPPAAPAPPAVGNVPPPPVVPPAPPAATAPAPPQPTVPPAPTPEPQPAPPPAAPAPAPPQPQAPAAPALDGAPPGYEQVWHMLDENQKAMVRQQVGTPEAQQPVSAVIAGGQVPPPPPPPV